MGIHCLKEAHKNQPKTDTMAKAAKSPKKVKKAKKVKDPNAPKRNLSAYFFFMNDQRPKVVKSNPDLKVTEVGKSSANCGEPCLIRKRHRTSKRPMPIRSDTRRRRPRTRSNLFSTLLLNRGGVKGFLRRKTHFATSRALLFFK